MPYATPENLTNMTAMLTYVNSVTNNLAVPMLMVLIPMVIAGVASLPYGVHVGIVMALFTGTLLAMIYSVAALVTNSTVLALIVLTSVAVIASLIMVKKMRGGLL